MVRKHSNIMASVLNDSTNTKLITDNTKLITEPKSDTEETTPSLSKKSGSGADIVKKSLPHAAKYRSSMINKGGVIRLRSTVNCVASTTYGLAEYLKEQANLSLG
jgi:hypothetical protein